MRCVLILANVQCMEQDNVHQNEIIAKQVRKALTHYYDREDMDRKNVPPPPPHSKRVTRANL